MPGFKKEQPGPGQYSSDVNTVRTPLDDLLITRPAWSQMKTPVGGCCSNRISVSLTLYTFLNPAVDHLLVKFAGQHSQHPESRPIRGSSRIREGRIYVRVGSTLDLISQILFIN